MWYYFSNELLESGQDQDFINKYLEKGKETRHFQLVSCQQRGKQEHQNARDQEYRDNLALLWHNAFVFEAQYTPYPPQHVCLRFDQLPRGPRIRAQ